MSDSIKFGRVKAGSVEPLAGALRDKRRTPRSGAPSNLKSGSDGPTQRRQQRSARMIKERER
jgi:hypothetical protein